MQLGVENRDNGTSDESGGELFGMKTGHSTDGVTAQIAEKITKPFPQTHSATGAGKDKHRMPQAPQCRSTSEIPRLPNRTTFSLWNKKGGQRTITKLEQLSGGGEWWEIGWRGEPGMQSGRKRGHKTGKEYI